MNLPTFLKRMKPTDNRPYVDICLPRKPELDFMNVFKLDQAQRRVQEVYETDPNKLDPTEVSEIFSDVLRSLEALKQAKPCG